MGRSAAYIPFIAAMIIGLTVGALRMGFLRTGASGAKNPLDSPEMQDLLASCRKSTTLLRPHRADRPIGFGRSKMGGTPNLNGFTTWPRCDACKTELNFVLQIYKSDYPGFYLPLAKNLFQLFRCPNFDCPAAYSERYDLKMFHYYFQAIPRRTKHFKYPSAVKKTWNQRCPTVISSRRR